MVEGNWVHRQAGKVISKSRKEGRRPTGFCGLEGRELLPLESSSASAEVASEIGLTAPVNRVRERQVQQRA